MSITDVPRATLALLSLLAGLLSSGCSHLTGSRLDLAGRNAGPEFIPQNYHQTTAWLPRSLRRVAVLPMTTVADESITESSREQLERLLPTELTRTELFEVVLVTPAQLRRWTGRPRWQATDSLPPDLFQGIQDQLGCDGVIFAHLTAYRPFPPLVMGWKLHLVDAHEPRVWWTCDLLYDAGDQTVARCAVRYERDHQASRLPTADPATILRSPGRFGQYTLATSLATLQRHEKNN